MEALILEIKQTWGKPANCEKCKQHKTLSTCESCKSVLYCGESCQGAHWSVHQFECISGGTKREREEEIEQEESIELNLDVFDLIINFLNLQDLKNVSTASKEASYLARRVMINKHTWRFTAATMVQLQEIGPKNIEIFPRIYNMLNSKYRNTIRKIRFMSVLQAIGNEPIKVPLPAKLFRVEFGGDFNQAIDFPPSTQEIIFKEFFNTAFVPPPNLKKLRFGIRFNRDLVLPNSLIKLVFGHGFNRPIVLNNGLKVVSFGNNFNQRIVFPDTIEDIYFGVMFNQPFALPPGLKLIHFSEHFNEHVNFPDTTEEIVFGYDFNEHFVAPPNLKNIAFGNDFNQVLEDHFFPETVRRIIFGDNFNQTLTNLPRNLISLKFPDYSLFNQKIILPPRLVEVSFGRSFNFPVEFPASVEKIEFFGNPPQEFSRPAALKSLRIRKQDISLI